MKINHFSVTCYFPSSSQHTFFLKDSRNSLHRIFHRIIYEELDHFYAWKLNESNRKDHIRWKLIMNRSWYKKKKPIIFWIFRSTFIYEAFQLRATCGYFFLFEHPVYIYAVRPRRSQELSFWKISSTWTTNNRSRVLRKPMCEEAIKTEIVFY